MKDRSGARPGDFTPGGRQNYIEKVRFIGNQSNLDGVIIL